MREALRQGHGVAFQGIRVALQPVAKELRPFRRSRTDAFCRCRGWRLRRRISGCYAACIVVRMREAEAAFEDVHSKSLLTLKRALASAMQDYGGLGFCSLIRAC